MAQDSRPRSAAVRKDKKAPAKGTGGQGKRKLSGKGPTPKAEDRVYHKAHRQKQLAERSAARRQTRRGPHQGSGSGAEDVVVGRNPVVEALQQHVPCRELLVAADIETDGRVREALQRCLDYGVTVKEVTKRQLDTISGQAVHQGIALTLEPFDYADPHDVIEQALAEYSPSAPETAPLFIACDSITDPRNLGAIIRAAAAFGAHGVIIGERRSARVTATTWKTSAGAAARIPVAQGTNLTQLIKDAQSSGYFAVGLDGEADRSLPELTVATEPLILVVGSEGKGISRLVAQTCDEIASIPMSSAVESLNASMAVGVSLYEISGRRRAAVSG